SVDHARLGFGASAHVILKLRQHNWRALRQKLLDIPEIWHVTLTGGPMDVILLVRARDNADLRRVVFDEIQPLDGVVDTQTVMIFEERTSDSALH
ncbi:MAG: Lrp/AsnC ligand binding domain-containing protein, partial [Yaniella sp.]